ncbi:AAA family ATPase [Pasteurella skyensis]|uniref:AAA family ATPase n=1 Tax=Phocoenobacter skyensis TaxID=97481 RepID=A0AAJ6NAE4_9PAST|nr:TOPRIM nucleotidyl transferase/hydrolase domain-containing protein [Pasteurella skyensis]MDP8163019.1 AAA family ATPase [Pasteurella skyensis]MDP8173173.1 AAA family ATPase [Pasteurella skyensis]MDP8176395.1 AAA family ATPase [Pasteurella skyensis]MDP8178894.1 AAA family ATPase [Pasteurella skyensis]MDP8183716.1 AAA family ATPase [Pasteurella skyensis]
MVAFSSQLEILINGKNNMQKIEKIKLHNFKRFENLEITFNQGINTIIGDNEAGKSTILQAIHLVASGSRNKVENIGLESILNINAIKNFFQSNAKYDDLPKVFVEIYFSQDDSIELAGKFNSEKRDLPGLRMELVPNENLSAEISQLLNQPNNFPFEFYIVKFMTFSGEAYSGYRKFLKTLLIDNTQLSSEYANKEYTKSIFHSVADETARIQLSNNYRQSKTTFVNTHLTNLNHDNFNFSIKSNSKANLDSDIALMQNGIPIENRGKGQQCFLKSEFALSKNNNIDVVLLEEPENHLSHTNMKKLINKIANSHEDQVILSTHNSLISSRLGLQHVIMLNSESEKSISLKDVDNDTSRFFMKAPDNNLLEFILSSKIILVEGNAEFILMQAMYEKVTNSTLENDGVHIISVGGLSFKRYLQVAQKLCNQVAVIRDNDKNHQENCVNKYEEYQSDNIKIFADKDNNRYTFEVCVYKDNEDICKQITKSTAPLDFMLNNKAESAFRLTEEYANELNIPKYIQEAIKWIRK